MIALAAWGLLLGTPIRLAAVGDVMLGRGIEGRLRDPQAWASVDRLLATADVRFGNLECVISDRPFSSLNKYRLRANPQAAQAVRGHWDMLSVANNHALDCGSTGLADTIAHLRAWGIRPVGLVDDATIVEVKGKRFGFLGYSAFSYPGIGNLRTWRTDVRALRPQVDWLIVSLHWGVEMSSVPSVDQIDLSSQMHSAGVDVILGHHPHIVQPVRDGTAYSLGDFIFDSPMGPRRRSGVLWVTLQAGQPPAYEWRPAKIVDGFPESDP